MGFILSGPFYNKTGPIRLSLNAVLGISIKKSNVAIIKQ